MGMRPDGSLIPQSLSIDASGRDYPWIDTFLKDRQDRGLLRKARAVLPLAGGRVRINGQELIDFSSNDYLGLRHRPELAEAGFRYAQKWGSGAGAARLMSGTLSIHEELEEKIAALKGTETALVFGSGFLLNSGVIPALAGRGDAVFADRLIHASMIDGIRLSGARLFRFLHNDTGALRQLLEKERSKYDRALILVESLYSMDGDLCPLVRMAELKSTYNAMLMVDEAHAAGVFGEKGAGLVALRGVTSAVDINMGTFSKALGSYGAYCACAGKMRDYLVNTARSFIYSTALPPSVIGTTMTALDLAADPSPRAGLLERAADLRDRLNTAGFTVLGRSQIVPVRIGEENAAVRIGQRLFEAGFLTLPVRYPTVPKGQARIRVSVTAAHTLKDLTRLSEAMSSSA